MYKSFYNFDKKPFQISTDPSFIWLGENHKEALATLKYGVLDNKGFLLLTGDVGTGKTTLINSLISSLTDQVIYAFVPDPRLEKLDFLNYIAGSFGINQEFTSKGKFIRAFSHFLREAYEQKKSVLLVIDESQLLTQELLEEVRLLSNINIDNSTILSIFFVGQNEFNEVISRPENRAVCHRLTLNYNLSSLDQEQTREYINHRLKLAGAKKEIFNSSAIRAIYDYSDGLPRRINVVCDHCLITGYVAGKKVIDEKDVLNCTSELFVPTYANSVSYPNRQRPLESELYVPSKELFQSEIQDGPDNGYLTEQYTQNNNSGEIEIKSDQILSDKKRSWLKWTTTVSFCFIVFIFLYQLLPESISETFISSLSLQSSSINESKLVEPELVENATIQQIVNNEELTSANVKIASGSKFSIETDELNFTSIQNEGIASTARTETEHNSEEEEQSIQQPEDVVSITFIEEPAESNLQHETLTIEETNPLISQNEDSDNSDPSEEYRLTSFFPESANLTEKIEKHDATTEQEVHISPQPNQLLTIRFNRNSVQFKAFDYELVESYVDYLIGNPASIAVITGHTDSSGSADYNYRISKYRAEIVKSYFMGRGVSDSQLEVIGVGPRKPIAENDTEEGRELNRRVEVKIQPDKQIGLTE